MNLHERSLFIYLYMYYYADDLSLSPTSLTMTSSIKLENQQNKQQRATMVKNLHPSEVITTAAAANVHHSSNDTIHYHSIVDPIEMTKLLSNITTTSTNSTIKKISISPTMDQPSRLNHFSWEEIEGRYLPVIYRYIYKSENSLIFDSNYAFYIYIFL
jgi:hypothetical protein